MNPRIVATTTVRGMFMFPMGFKFYDRKIGDWPKTVLVSTVLLDGGHLEAPVPGMMEPETGYETMVFLDGSAITGPLHTRRYATREDAVSGHREVVRLLLDEKLPLLLPVTYVAHDEANGNETERAQRMQAKAS